MNLEINKHLKSVAGLFLTLTVLIFSSCTKDKLTLYDEEANLYFEKIASDISKDSTSFSFAIKTPDLMVDTVYLKVRTMGKIRKTPGQINLKIAENSTAIAGKHYKILPYVMPADSFKVKLPVVVMRTPDLLKKEVFLDLNIVESEDFKPGVTNQLNYKIKINDFFSKPDNWDQRLSVFFGAFSQRKFAFIFKTLGLSKFVYPEEIPYSQMVFFKLKLKNALLEYEKENGPMIDELENRVVFPN